MFTYEQFQNPPDEFRGTDFWMLNDQLSESEIRFQLAEMKKQGIASFIARTYVGLKSDYPGPDFKSKLRIIVDTAREYGLKLYLQAGYMPEAVMDLPPELTLKVITRQPSASTSDNIMAAHEDYVYSLTDTQLYVDMLNPEAIAFYLKQSYEDMWADFSGDFGRTIVSIWVDEPSYSSSGLPWNSHLEETFKKRWGYEIRPEVLKLFVDLDNYASVRYHYWQIVRNLMRDAYFVQVREWCQNHNLLFSGHLMGEDSMEQQLRRAGAVMPFYQYFDIPGIDILTADMNWRNSPLKRRYDTPEITKAKYMTPLQCVSAAHQAGRTQILAEMYACSTENLTFRDQKYMFDHFAALGINHRSIHGIFYSLDGRRKRFFPPHINYYQPYWNDYRMLTDYCAQASWFISQGKPCRDILVIHPMGSGTSEYSPWGGPLQRDTEFLQLTQQLVHHQCEFELGDEDTLAQWGKIDGRQLQLGEMSYKYVVLPNLKIIAGTTLKLLTEFAAAGGTIFTLGQSPYLLDGIEADFILPESVQAKDSADLISLLKQYSTDYKLDTAIILNHRRDQQYDYFFLFNSDCSKPRKVKLDVPGKFIFPESNEFEIPEGGSVMILVDHTAPALPAKTQTMNAQIHPLSDVWNLKRNAPNVLLLEYASYRKADGEYSKIYPIIAIQDILQAENYDGDLTLRFEFDSDITLNHAQLAIEHPKEQQIRLNGHEISNLPDGYFLATQFQVLSLDIPVKPGKNIIEINRHFKPLSKARSVLTSLFDAQHGTELEALFLLGDFGVFSLEEASPRTPCIRMNHHFRLAPEPSHFTGELVNNGYPFYTGSVDLTQDFYLTAEQAATKAELYIEDINACLAEVLINGVPQGKIAWYPNSFPLNNLQTGLNTITVRLTNTLRNLLGPFHRPKGEYGSIFGGYGSALSWTGLVNEDTLEPIPDWYDHRIPDTNAWTEEYMLIPFGLRKAAIQS